MTGAALLGLALLGAGPTDRALEQPPFDPSRPGSHEAALELMSGAANRTFEAVLTQYDAYLQLRPDDVSTWIERCGLLRDAACGEDEGCPHWKEYERCADELEQRFPGAPAVEIYRLEEIWGEKAIEKGTALLDGIARFWEVKDVARIHQKLAQCYDVQKRAGLVLEHASHAMELDRSIDLTLIAARALEHLGRRDAAVHMLVSRPMRPEQYPLELQKVRMLADLGAFSEAEMELHLLGDPPEGQGDPLLEARIFSAVGRVVDARAALARAQQSPAAQWRARAIAQERFDLELAFGDPGSALAAYDELREKGSWDPLLRDRVRVAIHHPDAPWRARDALALLETLALLLAILCLPGLLLVPVHYVGLLRARRHPDRAPRATRFGLRQCWWMLVLLVFTQLPIFYMEGVPWLEDMFREDVSLVSARAPIPDHSLALALAMIAPLGLAGLVPILRRRDLALLGRGRWSWRRTIGMAIAWLVLVRVAALAWVALFPDLASHAMTAAVLPAKPASYTWQMVAAVRRVYGLPVLALTIVFAIPLFEEISFRGVLLQGLSRHLPAGFANAIQAGLFAAGHEQWGMFPILFGLALGAGSMARRSGGLAGPLLLHASNNALAFLVFARLPISG